MLKMTTEQQGQTGRAGRPAFLITEEQIRGLREGADFRWRDIARILVVSTRTLSRHRQGFGMPVGQEHTFSQITDFALDNIIRDVLALAPQSGVGLFSSWCSAIQRAASTKTSRYCSLTKIGSGDISIETNKKDNTQDIQCSLP